MVKSRGLMDPKDLASDTLLVGLENYSKLKNKKALLSYLFSTANNICLNQIRRKKFSGYYDENEANNIAESHYSIENAIDITILYAALDRLPPLQKEAVTLFEISDLRIKDIMVIQNAKSSTVKQRIKRGREKLAELMQEKNKKRKIAALASVVISINSFGMETLDLYFQEIKQQTLPLSNTEAINIITNFQAPPAPAFAKVIGKSILKKSLIGTILISGLTTVVVLSSTQTVEARPKKDHKPSSTLIAQALETKIESKETLNEPRNKEVKKLALFAEDTIQIKRNTDLYETHKSKPLPTEYNRVEPDKIFWDNPDNSNSLIAIKTTGPTATPKSQPPIKRTTKRLENTDFENVEEFDLKGIKTLNIHNIAENIEFRTWDKNIAKIEINYNIEAKDEEDKAVVLKNVKYTTQKKGSEFIIKQNSEACNSKTTSLGPKLSKTKVKYKNGDKAKYNSIERTCIITIPESINLKLSNKNGWVTLPLLKASLTATIYNSTFETEDIDGSVDLNVRYSNATIGNFQNGKIKLYSSNLTFGNTNELELNPRYSDVLGKNCSNLEINAYQSKINLNTEAINGSLKYSSFKSSQSINTAKIVAYQSKFYATRIAKLEGNIKYSTIKADEISKLIISQIYSSKIDVDKIDVLEAESSKYTTYLIERLGTRAIVSSYSDKLRIEIVSSEFNQLNFDGKYTNYSVKLEGKKSYMADFRTQYGKLDYDKSILENSSTETTGSLTHLKGTAHGPSVNSAAITFDCYSSNISLK